MYAAGEGTTKLNEEFPQRYAKARAVYASKAQDSTASAASTLVPRSRDRPHSIAESG
jgi:hypothetical protein